MIESFAQQVVHYRFVVIGVWVVVAIAALPAASRVGQVLTVEGEWARPVESAEADAIIEGVLPRARVQVIAIALRGATAVDSAPSPSVVRSLTRAISGQPYVEAVVSPLDTELALVSDDRRTSVIVVTIRAEHSDTASNFIPTIRRTVQEVMASHTADPPLEVAVTGAPALEWDVRNVSVEDARRGELRALAPMAAVLILAFGALAAAVIPVVIGVLAVTCALAALVVVGTFTPVVVFVLPIISMAGLGVGVDYSLFIVSRFREELGSGQSPSAASLRATATAGRAVIVSGLTVSIGFAVLLLTPASETRSIGVGGLLVVVVAVALATTLLPAILAVIGRHIDWPRGLARSLRRYHAASLWRRWSRVIGNHRYAALGSGLVLIAALAWPVTQLEIGVPPAGWFPPDTESSRGMAMMAQLEGRGALLPVRVVLQAPPGERLVGARHVMGLIRLSETVRADHRVANIVGPVDLGGKLSVLQYVMLYSDMSLAAQRHPYLVDGYVSRDGQTVLMDIAIADTATMATAMNLVRDIRQMAQGGLPGLDSVVVKVAGTAAGGVDEEDAILASMPLMVFLVVLITGIVLAAAFRSVLVPVKAILMNLLSVAGALGLIVIVFQWGLGSQIMGLEGPTGAVFVVVPILVFAVVFGLSMDYEVFLLSRIKEAYDESGDNDAATMAGIRSTASIITSAAAIMVVVFGTFAFSRVLVVQFLGFALAVAVLLEATLIRMVIVPAFMHVAGRWNWWPGNSS